MIRFHNFIYEVLLLVKDIQQFVINFLPEVAAHALMDC